MAPNEQSNLLSNLRPGDMLLYSRHSFVSWAIKLKTWSNYSHVEVYLGRGRTHAARDSAKFWGTPAKGTGVNTYAISFDDLVQVRRPRPLFNLEFALQYAHAVDGEHYDIFGILRFFRLGKQSSNRQFCSEDSTRLYRTAGIEPFDTTLAADQVSPRDLAVSAAFSDIWLAEDFQP